MRGRGGFLVVALAVLAASCRNTRSRDVVVVTLDTVRADRLGCYGSRAGATPALDRFAASGVIFTDASAAVPLTLPSHATLFTGRYPSSTGVRNNGSFFLPESETTLAEVLRRSGWTTAAVIAAYPLQSRYGLAQGFDVYDEELPKPAVAAGQAFSVHFSERDAKAVTDRALSIWGRMEGRPRFLWVHYFDAHAPYDPPEPYRSAHAAAPYEGEIAYVDAELSRLLDRIGADAPAAAVVIAGDHGEGLGEHGEKTHGVFLYQSTLHVPLLIRVPGSWPAGRKVDAPVSLADVMPTLLAALGLPPQPKLDGADLAPLVRGTGAPPSREVYAESYLPRLQFRFSPLTMLRAGHLKYVDAPLPEMYDLAADPGESENLSAIAGRRSEADDLARRLAAFVSRADSGASARASGALDAESEARLRSLGYASAGTLAAGSGGRGRDPKTMTDYLARYDRAVGLVASGKIDEGLGELRALVPEAPENYMARYQLAAGLIAAGRTAEARRELDRVVAEAPEFGNGHLMLAGCLGDLGELDAAIERFEKAAALLPTQAEPKLAEGRLLERRGRFDAAADAYLEALAREPGSAEAADALETLRRGRGDDSRVIADFRSLTERFPGAAGAWTALGKALARSGDDRGASEATARALALDPGREDALVLSARLLVRARRPKQAVSDLRALLARDPDSEEAAIELGRALLATDPEGEAPAWIEHLTATYPRSASPWVLRGALLERRGDAPGAASAFREALTRDPHDPDARAGLSRVTGR